MSNSSRLMVQQQDEVTIVDFLDRSILDEGSIQQIGDEVQELINRAAVPKLLINFENVDHLSSAALGMLITINNRVRAKDGQLKLANISGQIFEVFSITKLDKLFQIHETVEQARAKFK